MRAGLPIAGRPIAGRRVGGRRVAGLVATVGALAFIASSNVPPLRVDCPPDVLAVETCRDIVDATLRRGLGGPHPLILAARVEPGSAGANEYGHRATVTYDLLGVPYATVVRLYYDAGGHWGGESDRSTLELAAWWAAPVVVLLLMGGTLVTRRQPPRAGPPGPPSGAARQ